MGSSILDMDGLEYVVVPGQNIVPECQELHGKILDFWKVEWQKVFSKIDPEYKLNTTDFLRQSKICAILSGSEVVGLQTLGVHILSDFLEQDYFKPYTIEFFQTLNTLGVRKFQTMQFFLVSDKWGVRATGQNFAAIILGLSFNHQVAERLDATITLARKDVPASSTANKFNMNQVGANILMHNVSVGQLLCMKPGSYPRPEVCQAINSLWSKRKDYVQHYKGDENYEPIRSPISIEN
jgi:hypothetical protein